MYKHPVMADILSVAALTERFPFGLPFLVVKWRDVAIVVVDFVVVKTDMSSWGWRIEQRKSAPLNDNDIDWLRMLK